MFVTHPPFMAAPPETLDPGAVDWQYGRVPKRLSDAAFETKGFIQGGGHGRAAGTTEPKSMWAFTKAAFAFRLAAAALPLALALGLASASALAGYAEGKAAFDKNDFDTAWRELDPLAKKGDAKAMFLIASMYHTGRGVPISYKDAAEWYLKSANAGEVQGVFMMGVVYEGGIGQPRSIEEAFKWYKKSADRGFYAGILKVANMYGKGQGVPKDNAAAYLWYAIAELRAPKDSNDRYELPIVKDKLSTLLTKEQVADAERKAKAWKPSAK